MPVISKEEILSFAKQASQADGTDTTQYLERFAELVALHEREACAQMCEAYIAPGLGGEMARAIRRRSLR